MHDTFSNQCRNNAQTTSRRRRAKPRNAQHKHYRRNAQLCISRWQHSVRQPSAESLHSDYNRLRQLQLLQSWFSGGFVNKIHCWLLLFQPNSSVKYIYRGKPPLAFVDVVVDTHKVKIQCKVDARKRNHIMRQPAAFPSPDMNYACWPPKVAHCCKRLHRIHIGGLAMPPIAYIDSDAGSVMRIDVRPSIRYITHTESHPRCRLRARANLRNERTIHAAIISARAYNYNSIKD